MSYRLVTWTLFSKNVEINCAPPIRLKINTFPTNYFIINPQKPCNFWRLPGVKNKTPTSLPCKYLIMRVGPAGNYPDFVQDEEFQAHLKSCR